MFKPKSINEIRDRITALQDEQQSAVADLSQAQQELADARFDGDETLVNEARVKVEAAERTIHETQVALSIAQERLAEAEARDHEDTLAKLRKEREALLKKQGKQAGEVEATMIAFEIKLAELASTMQEVDSVNAKIDPTIRRLGGRQLRFNVLRSLQLHAPTVFASFKVSLPGLRLTKDSPPLAERLKKDDERLSA